MLIFYSWMFFDRQGENAGLFGVPGGIRLKHLFDALFLLLCSFGVGKGSENNPPIHFPLFPAMLCLSVLVSTAGRRGSMSQLQFCLSNMTVRDKMLFFLVKLESFCRKLAEVCHCNVILLYKSNPSCCREWCINGFFP